MYGHVLHYTGCRPTEVLQLTVGRVLISEQALVLRSLKKRKIDRTGQERAPQYRTVPVPAALIESLGPVFNSAPASGRAMLLSITVRRKKNKMVTELWTIFWKNNSVVRLLRVKQGISNA